jgi:hypothetical protein
VLAGLGPLAPLTVAYEEWMPTVPAAVRTLRPLGPPAAPDQAPCSG